MGKMLKDPEQKAWADSVRIVFPVFENGGTHVNISGIAPVSYTHLRAHETPEHLVCRLLLEKKKKSNNTPPVRNHPFYTTHNIRKRQNHQYD